MKPKRKLQLDSLFVSSFHTSHDEPAARGTVEARGEACTDPATCKCQTSLWACGTIRATAFSCPPTQICA